jgi:hypothetical protein
MLLLESQDGTRRYDMVLKAYMSITAKRHLHAAILHYCHGVPITCKQRGKRSLQRHFRTNPRQIRYWIATALAEMRAALGKATN